MSNYVEALRRHNVPVEQHHDVRRQNLRDGHVARRNVAHKMRLAAELDALQAANVRAGKYGRGSAADVSKATDGETRHFMRADGSEFFMITVDTPSIRRRKRDVENHNYELRASARAIQVVVVAITSATRATLCSICQSVMTVAELAMGWPVTTEDGCACPSCYGDEAYCPEGHLLRADTDSDMCEVCAARVVSDDVIALLRERCGDDEGVRDACNVAMSSPHVDGAALADDGTALYCFDGRSGSVADARAYCADLLARRQAADDPFQGPGRQAAAYEASLAEALAWAATASHGEYLVEYKDTGMTDAEDPASRCGYDDMELVAIRTALSERDLTLVADDRGLVAQVARS